MFWEKRGVGGVNQITIEFNFVPVWQCAVYLLNACVLFFNLFECGDDWTIFGLIKMLEKLAFPKMRAKSTTGNWCLINLTIGIKYSAGFELKDFLARIGARFVNKILYPMRGSWIQNHVSLGKKLTSTKSVVDNKNYRLIRLAHSSRYYIISVFGLFYLF